jgi:hypothetical protein
VAAEQLIVNAEVFVHFFKGGQPAKLLEGFAGNFGFRFALEGGQGTALHDQTPTVVQRVLVSLR